MARALKNPSNMDVTRPVMKILLMLFGLLLPAVAFAAEPMSNEPVYDPVPGEFGSGGQHYTVPLPPGLPPYLPNGAVNLDEAWIQDGGARLYWNDVIIPRQLKMDGAYWIDPALVPQLVITPKKQQTRRYRAPRARVVNPAPKNAGSTALKSPAIPLPMEPVQAVPAPKPARPQTTAPFSPATGRGPITTDTTTPLPPPRLQ